MVFNDAMPRSIYSRNCLTYIERHGHIELLIGGEVFTNIIEKSIQIEILTRSKLLFHVLYIVSIVLLIA